PMGERGDEVVPSGYRDELELQLVKPGESLQELPVEAAERLPRDEERLLIGADREHAERAAHMDLRKVLRAHSRNSEHEGQRDCHPSQTHTSSSREPRRGSHWAPCTSNGCATNTFEALKPLEC